MKFLKSKIGIAAISVALTLVFMLVILPRITSMTSNWGVAEIAIVISIFSLIIQLTPPFIEYRFSQKNLDKEHQQNLELQAKAHQDNTQLQDAEHQFNKLGETFYTIDLGISVLEDGNVSFAATIENAGIQTIHPKHTKLYIDQGRNSNKPVYEYGFHFMLEHKNNDDGTEDCVLCRRCKIENNNNYPIDTVPEPFKTEMTNGTLFTGCFELEHLSGKSIKYIRSRERFQEDIIIKFSNSGVYRATLLVITEDADCQCATKQFYIKTSN